MKKFFLFLLLFVVASLFLTAYEEQGEGEGSTFSESGGGYSENSVDRGDIRAYLSGKHPGCSITINSFSCSRTSQGERGSLDLSPSMKWHYSWSATIKC